MLLLVHAARAHIELFVLQVFVAQTTLYFDFASTTILNELRSLFALTTMKNSTSLNALGFSEDEYISFAQLQDVRMQVNKLLEKLMSKVVGLRDAWGFLNACLGSALRC